MRWLTVVEAVLQVLIDLDHVVGTADDFRFHVTDLALIEGPSTSELSAM